MNMKLCYFGPFPRLYVLWSFFSKPSIDATVQAFTYSVLHGVGDSDHTVKEGSPSSCHSNPLFSLNLLKGRSDKKKKKEK